MVKGIPSVSVCKKNVVKMMVRRALANCYRLVYPCGPGIQPTANCLYLMRSVDINPDRRAQRE